MSQESREGFAPLCPDVVFEVRSKSDTPQDLRTKMQVYLANGARVGILIDPYRRTVEVHRTDRDPEIHTDATTLAFDPELPGFALDLTPIMGT